MAFPTMSVLGAYLYAERQQKLQQENAQLSNLNTESLSGENPIGTTKRTTGNTAVSTLTKVNQKAITNTSSVYCTDLDDIMP